MAGPGRLHTLSAGPRRERVKNLLQGFNGVRLELDDSILMIWLAVLSAVVIPLPVNPKLKKSNTIG